MKKLVQYIIAVNLTLNLMLLISLVSIILIDTVFIKLPELFDGGSGLLNAYYNFCIGMVASYIFYFVVVHIKEEKDKKNIGPYIGGKSMLVVNDYERFIRAVGYTNENQYPSQFEIKRSFEQIDPNSRTPSMMCANTHQNVTWFQYMNYFRTQSQESIGKVFEKMPFLDSELVKLLSDIDNCSYFAQVEFISKVPHCNENLSVWSEPFYEYSLLCQKLKLYNQRYK